MTGYLFSKTVIKRKRKIKIMEKVSKTIALLVLVLAMPVMTYAQSWDAKTSTYTHSYHHYAWNLTTSDKKIQWVNKTPQRSTTSMLVNGGEIVVRVSSSYVDESLDVWDYFDEIAGDNEEKLKQLQNANSSPTVSSKVSEIKSSKSTIAGTHAVKTTYTNTLTAAGTKVVYKAIDYIFYHSGYYYSLEINYNTSKYSATMAQALFQGFSFK